MAELTLTQTGAQTQEMRHEQTMTHQQIQALELLAAPVMDLKAAVNRELERNPALEDQDSMGEDGESLQSEEEQTPEQEDEEQWLETLLQVDDHIARPSRTYGQYSAEDEEPNPYILIPESQ